MNALVVVALMSPLFQDQPKPTLLFDGKTLDGWTKVGGGEWSVEGGAIVGKSKPGQPQGLLVCKEPVGDFIAKCSFRISAGDSGFYFRTKRIDVDPFCEGFQVEIDTSPETGGIYETNGRGWVNFPDAKLHELSKYRAGEWATLEVYAVGTRYKVYVNGTKITDIKDPLGRTEGALALQLHGDMEMDVMFKDLVLTHVR